MCRHCDGAHLCLHVGGLQLQKDAPHKELDGDKDKIFSSLTQLFILIISPFKFELKAYRSVRQKAIYREFDLTVYPYHLSI